ncbi:NtaA/DmoA family FMN-dependent monooxygenase [Nakamurella leprariae]|uniref:NtaA/DmoA family FMN-dependent monooxygenase n=1 Tax=Nakamurella leprariae TaxID=2803911 RepID=A0A939BYR5_9ACTN|nr:NtaA/DmoA family FMN-dependent monooxygenase [Nakamurella leprariae]MBM9467365.1 NtaA/DmoA family FMN-dependent monooxygenase [Nakamurella leprariae]
MFHLGAFTSFKPVNWAGPWSGDSADTWADGSFWIDMLVALERAKFDYVMFEDSSMVSDAYGGTMENDLKYALYAPKHDPMMLMPLLAKYTDHIGLIATGSTTLSPPWMLARTLVTLDHISHGRSGWNVVTSSEDRAAQNYGLPTLPEHDDRYDRAEEFVELVTALMASWDPDALVMDRDTNTYVDAAKVHTIDFQGRYHSSRGPLNTLAPPNGKPIYCQAGSSPRGRDFAAKHADTILVSIHGVEQMAAYRVDMHRRMEAIGRDPSTCKLLFVVMPVLGDTERAATAKRTRSTRNIDAALGSLSAITEIDFSAFDLDQPLPAVTTNGHAGYLAEFARVGAAQSTLRELVNNWSISCLDLVGTPETVAEQMAETMEIVGGDGFLIAGVSSRRYLTEVVDGLAPALQAIGATRSEYSSTTLRGNLMEF